MMIPEPLPLGLVVVCLFSWAQYRMFLKNVVSYSRGHSHDETLQYADAIRPSVVTMVDRVAKGSRKNIAADVSLAPDTSAAPRRQRRTS